MLGVRPLAEELSVISIANMGRRAEHGGPSGVGAQGPLRSKHHMSL